MSDVRNTPEDRWENLEELIDDRLGDYSFEGDHGSYSPSENERFVMKDFLMGLLADDEFLRTLKETLYLRLP